MRRQLLSDFEAYAEPWLSNSGLGSGPEVPNQTIDEIYELIAAMKADL